jgi:hypothetical protein
MPIQAIALARQLPDTNAIERDNSLSPSAA